MKILEDPKIYSASIDIVADVKDGKLISIKPENQHGFIELESQDGYIENLVKNISYKIIDEHGPAGGWPYVEFTGTKLQLLPILKACAADDTINIEKELEQWDGSNEALINIIG